MNKKFFVFMILAIVMATGVVFAQESSFGLGMNSETMLNNGSSLDLMAFGTGAGFMTHNPILAACLNIPLGLWSWLNQDWFGGAIVSVSQIGGVVLMVVLEDPTISAIGIGLVIGGTIGGAVRAFILSRALGGGTAEVSNNNPLSRINIVALPDGKGGTVGSFTYSHSW